MIASNLARLIITAILMLLVFTNTTELWMLFIISIAFGITDAFFHPANMAITPIIVEENQLEAANAATMGTGIAIGAVGPGIAGVLVSQLSLGLSFFIDAITFGVALFTEVLMHTPKTTTKPAEHQQGVIKEIRAMLAYVAQDIPLRDVLLISTALNFFFNGALAVGPAALAKNRYPEGAVALGVIISAFSVGALLGMIAGGTWKPKRFGLYSLLFIGLSGFTLGYMGLAPTMVTASIAAIITGAATGFANIVMLTWLQRRITKDMMGCVMSLLGLAAFGLTPISAALSGVVASINLTALFVICGVGLVLTSVASLSSPLSKLSLDQDVPQESIVS
jgi:MFS family permease